jgi:ketosteroid isomerase-like protein
MGAGVWTIRDGKIVHVVWFQTRDEALEAAGLSPEYSPKRAAGSPPTVASREGEASSARVNRDTSLMVSAKLELVRSLYAGWERGDFSSVEWAHPEIEFVIADGPSAGSWRGLPGLTEGYREWLAGWEEIRVMGVDYYELDEERVIVLVRGSGHGRTSGLELERIGRGRGANLFHVRDGRVTRLVLYYDGERALADLGLSSETGSPRS